MKQIKAYLDCEDIMERYQVGKSNAMGIIHSVRDFCGGGKLPAGKILPSELAYWESLPMKNEVRCGTELGVGT